MATQYHFTVTNETIEVKRGKVTAPSVPLMSPRLRVPASQRPLPLQPSAFCAFPLELITDCCTPCPPRPSSASCPAPRTTASTPRCTDCRPRCQAQPAREP